MRNADTVLNIIRDRGRRGLPLEQVYRQLFNPDLYLHAYAKLARNHGALTPGATTETVDGMSLKKIQDIIGAVRSERYRWSPVRRVFIAKQGSTKRRPLGIPTWSDKLLQEVIRLILEAYYEPQFSDHSHGFRPGRGCHTALQRVHYTWKGTKWFIEGDIAACFDSFDHQVLLAILSERIHDNRFLRLIENLLRAGYMEDWRFTPTLSGTPQGGIVSPILANIYLDRLDQFVETTLIPAHNRGETRHRNAAYQQVLNARRSALAAGDQATAKLLRRQSQSMPAKDPNDPGYERLRYLRYADDFLLGYVGPRATAEQLTDRLRQFLRETLKLDLSEAKTLVTHATSEPARFLGYDLSMAHNDQQRLAGRRTINGAPTLRVPPAVIAEHCRRYTARGKPQLRPERLHDAPFSIVAQYQAEYAGLVNYYRMAVNLRTLNRLRWTMEQSLTHTLARKLSLHVTGVYRKYRTTIRTDQGPRKALVVRVDREGKPPLVATWGGISLARDVKATLTDTPPVIWNTGRSELLQRLLADTCELCGAQDRLQVHHIRALRDLARPGRAALPRWKVRMIARRRKTLVVCQPCHLQVIHQGDSQDRGPRKQTAVTGEPCALKGARTVRRGAAGKVPAAT
jgi:group II intron reverse transcriptase/maturase